MADERRLDEVLERQRGLIEWLLLGQHEERRIPLPTAGLIPLCPVLEGRACDVSVSRSIAHRVERGGNALTELDDFTHQPSVCPASDAVPWPSATRADRPAHLQGFCTGLRAGSPLQHAQCVTWPTPLN